MSHYRRRLERDLEGWIGRGLVPAESRAAILDSVSEARRLDAATVLAVIGALLAGVAVIAFAAANWAAIPRLVRFVLILSAFLGAAGGAAYLHGKGRETASHAVLSLAALIFAGAIGLTGQIFDIAGDPQAALRGAGLGAVLLALAGRSPWAAAAGLIFIGLGDVTDGTRFGSDRSLAGWLVLAAPFGAAVALIWRSQVLAHAAGVGAILAVLTFDRGLRMEPELVFGLAALGLAAAAAGARFLRYRYDAPAGVLYGWFVWGSLLWFGVAGFSDGLRGALHSIVWMTLSVGVVVLGRHDRLGLVTAAGVVSLLAAGAVLLFNLGVGLLTAAAVFGGLALAALAVALLLKRRAA
jgi:uncharacterized membrane protein